MTIDFATAVAPALTLANARAHAAQTDQYVWAANLIEALDIRATEARINWIEDQFDALLSA
jgi:hypothetical protein